MRLVLRHVLLVKVLDNCVLVWLMLVRKFRRERKKGKIAKISCYMPKMLESIELHWNMVYTIKCPLYGWLPAHS